MKKPFILLAACSLCLFLYSCQRNEATSPQPAPAAKPHAQTLVSLGSEAWDPMTKHCDRIGRGCKEDVILCLTPNFAAELFAILDAGEPGAIRSFFNDPQHADCLPAQLTSDPGFMTLVNEGQMYSRFYEQTTNPQRRVYLFGDEPNLTINNNLLIAPIAYQ